MQELARVAELLSLEASPGLLAFVGLVLLFAVSGRLRAAMVLMFAGVLAIGNTFLVQQYRLSLIPSTYVMGAIVVSAVVLIAVTYRLLQAK